MDNYQKLLQRISTASKLELEEIERKIEAKRAKLSGLISREGAAQIVAAELGINFDQERMKISEIVDGMKRVNLVGKIIQMNPVREFNKNNRQGKVASFLLADDSSNVRTILWDTNHIDLIESGKIKQGSVIEVSNASVRNAELHLSTFSELKQSKEQMPEVIEQPAFSVRKIADAKTGNNLKIRAIIVNTFEPRYFEVNPETGKKFTEADKNNGLKPEKRALLNVILDDGSETIRAVAFGQEVEKLGLTKDQIFSVEEFAKAKPNLLGTEKLFSGQIRLNNFSNTNELTIQGIEEVNPDELIKELETKS